MVKEFLPPMIERNSGHIVAISSLSSYVGGEDRSVYAASKFGVTGKSATYANFMCVYCGLYITTLWLGFCTYLAVKCFDSALLNIQLLYNQHMFKHTVNFRMCVHVCKCLSSSRFSCTPEK